MFQACLSKTFWHHFEPRIVLPHAGMSGRRSQRKVGYYTSNFSKEEIGNIIVSKYNMKTPVQNKALYAVKRLEEKICNLQIQIKLQYMEKTLFGMISLCKKCLLKYCAISHKNTHYST